MIEKMKNTYSVIDEIKMFIEDSKQAKKIGLKNRKKWYISGINFFKVNFRSIYSSMYYYLFKTFKKNGRYELRQIHDSLMLLPLNDIGLSKDLLTHGTRENLSVKFLKKIIRKGDYVIDIGANIGYYCLIESKLTGKTGKVFAIEPSKTNIDLLKINVFLNEYHHVSIFNMAMGNEDGIIDFFLAEKSNRHTVFKYSESSGVKTKVKLEKLDTFVESNKLSKLNFIRMDPEGYETEIIKGASKTLKKFKPRLFIETHSALTKDIPDRSVKKMLRDLKEIGYVVEFLSIGNRVEKLDINQIMEDIRFADETKQEKTVGRKATFRIFLKHR